MVLSLFAIFAIVIFGLMFLGILIQDIGTSLCWRDLSRSCSCFSCGTASSRRIHVVTPTTFLDMTEIDSVDSLSATITANNDQPVEEHIMV